MANYGVDIELSVKGLNHLRQLEREINSIEQAAQKVRTIDVSGATKTSVSVLEAERRALQLSGKERRQNLILANRAVQTENKINEILQKRQQIQERNRQVRARGKDALSSAIIGGGFPLLFGQGGVAAAGGLVGGAVGGALGGGFGFALSILGTAIGDAVTKAVEFEKSLIKLNARTADLGAASIVTGKDVDRLAKSLSIAKEDAMELFAAFAEFDRVADKQSLALIFGDDPGRFDRLAAATTEAKLAEEIFADRKRIGNETADQLLDQLKLGNAAAVELGLAEARLRIAEKQAIKDAERVTLMDRILAAAATSQMSMDIMDPAVYGQERGEKLAKEFDKNRQERLDAFKKSLEEVRNLIKKVSGFQPDKAGEKAAREEERRRKAAQKLLDASTKRVRELARETELVRRTTEFRDKIAELERVGDSSSAIRQQGELRLFEIEQARQLQIERINPKLEEQARLLEEAGINAKSLAEADEARADTARRLADLAYQNAQNIRRATYENSEQKKLFEQQQALAQGISNTLGTSMMQGFEALITGAQRFDEALRNIVVYTLQEMARQLLKILVIEQAIQAIRGFLSPTTIPFPDHPTHGNVPMQPLPPVPKALGGAVSAGQSYLVGEKGPELFMPGAKGNIIPNSALGGMGGGGIVVNVDAKGSTVEGNGDQANQLGKVIGAAIQQELIKQKKPGGLLA